MQCIQKATSLFVSVSTLVNVEYKPFKIDSTTKQRIPFPLLIRSLWGQPGDWHRSENPACGPSQLQNSEKEEIRAGRKRSGRLSRVLIDSQSNFSRFPMIERQDKRGTCFSQTCPQIFRPWKNNWSNVLLSWKKAGGGRSNFFRSLNPFKWTETLADEGSTQTKFVVEVSFGSLQF